MSFNLFSVCSDGNKSNNQNVNTQRRRINSSSHDLTKKEEEIKRLTNELEEERENSQNLLDTNDLLSSQIKTIKNQLNKSMNDNITNNKNLQQEIDQLQLKLQSLKTEFIETQKNSKLSSQKINKLQNELEKSKKELQNEIIKQNELKKQLKENINKYQNDIQSDKYQIQQQKEEYHNLELKYREIETQRNELLAKINDNNNDNNSNELLEQLEKYQNESKNKDDIISELKLKIINISNNQKNNENDLKKQINELNNKLVNLNKDYNELNDKYNVINNDYNDACSRTDGLQDLMETKSLQIMQYKEQVENLKNEINNLNELLSSQRQRSVNNVQINTVTDAYADDNDQDIPITYDSDVLNDNMDDDNDELKAFKLPLDYFVSHFGDYQSDSDTLLNIWNKIDINGDNEITVSCLNEIFIEFIKLIKVKYIEENIETSNNTLYNIYDKENINILNEKELIYSLKSYYSTGISTRNFIKDKEIITKILFIKYFINIILDTNYNNNTLIDERYFIYNTDNINDIDDDDDNKDDDDDDDDGIPDVYNNGLIIYNPSILSKASSLFNAAKDSNQLRSWIKDFDKKLDKGGLKERLANMLTSRNAEQRGLIINKYPELFNDIKLKLKKGHVVTLCELFCQSSISLLDAFCINKGIMNNNLEDISNILCTRNNKEIRNIISAYSSLYYNSSLIKKVSDVCDKLKKNSSIRMRFKSNKNNVFNTI